MSGNDRRHSLARDLRSQRFWTRFGTQFFLAVGVMASVLGTASALFPAALPPWGPPLAAAVVVISFLFATWRSWPRPIGQKYQRPATEIHVTVGDIFEQEGNVVIGMSTTFDTEIPHTIAPSSIQGQLLTRVYSGDLPALERDLTNALTSAPPCGSFMPADNKRGKQEIYPLGTVAVISQSPRKLYFCVAYTEMKADCTVQGSVDGVWRSLNELWATANARGNGDPISIPVIGGGQSRLSQQLPLQDSVRLTALSFIFASRHRPVSQSLNIVVRPQDLKNLDALEIQSFLRSLRPS